MPDIAALVLALSATVPIVEICANDGTTLEDYNQSLAYKEIFELNKESRTRAE